MNTTTKQNTATAESFDQAWTRTIEQKHNYDNCFPIEMVNTWSGECEGYSVTHIAVKQLREFINEETPFEHLLFNQRCNYVIALYFNHAETSYKLFPVDTWEIRHAPESLYCDSSIEV